MCAVELHHERNAVNLMTLMFLQVGFYHKKITTIGTADPHFKSNRLLVIIIHMA
jgi:hypothetical protein